MSQDAQISDSEAIPMFLSCFGNAANVINYQYVGSVKIPALIWQYINICRGKKVFVGLSPAVKAELTQGQCGRPTSQTDPFITL